MMGGSWTKLGPLPPRWSADSPSIVVTRRTLMPHSTHRSCDDFLTSPISRHRFLPSGALGATWLTFTSFFAAQAGATPTQRSAWRARSCILLHQFGGPSHLDTFDPKPEAPANIRGPFGVAATRVPGVRFSDQLPR